MTIRSIPLLLVLAAAVMVLEDALSLENLVRASLTALAVGVPLLFLIGLCVQVLPRRWYEE